MVVSCGNIWREIFARSRRTAPHRRTPTRRPHFDSGWQFMKNRPEGAGLSGGNSCGNSISVLTMTRYIHTKCSLFIRQYCRWSTERGYKKHETKQKKNTYDLCLILSVLTQKNDDFRRVSADKKFNEVAKMNGKQIKSSRRQWLWFSEFHHILILPLSLNVL